MSESRDASGRLTFDFNSIDSNEYSKVVRKLEGEFNLSPANELTIGVNEKFQDFNIGEQVVGLEWDNWLGFTVCAKKPESEGLARKLAGYIQRNIVNGT